MRRAVNAADRILRGVEGYEAVGIVCGSAWPVCAPAVRAARNWAGNSFPRRSARRRIPEQAFALKKYRCGTSPVSSVCDNEHTATALGDSKPLSVKNAVGEPIPEFCQRPKEGAKIPSFSRRQYSGDVFPYHPLGPQDANKLSESEGQVATRVFQSFSQPCDRERLARSSSAEKRDRAALIQHFLREFRHVAQVFEFPVVVNHCGRERLNL
jgi:hypothetical protein